MKVLQVLPELNVGGVETGTVDFAKYLVAHGHRAVVVSNGGALVAELEKAGIHHYILPVHKKSLWTMISSIRQLKKIIIGEGVDIVHARSRVPAWVAFFASRRTNAEFITTCHGYYSRHLFSRVMGWSKLIIAPSEVIGKHMRESFGVSAENIRIIPRSVDLEKFSFPRENHPGKSHSVISMVGRITPLKGHSYFLKAMAKVVRQMPYVKIWIIGDAPVKKEFYKQELQLLVKRWGLTDHVEFLGNRRDIPQLLAKTDCLVLSTVTQEAFGRVILEAQAAGVPVVATKVGGVVEIIDDGKTGILVQPKDTDGMADAVMSILKDRKLAQQLAAEAKKKLEGKFTLEHMAGKTLKVYEELLEFLNILVIKISSVGDVVLVTASLRAIRRKFPKAKIYCLVGKESMEVLQRCPYLDGIIIYDSKEQHKGLRGLLKIAKKLQRHKFDKIVDFQNNLKSHLLAFLSFSRESYGYDNGKLGSLLTHRLKNEIRNIPPVEHQFQLLKILGIEHDQRNFLELWPSPKDFDYAQELLNSEWLGNSENIIGINISASEKWKTKNWPLVHIARLCDILSSKNIRVLITGTEKDKNSARELLSITKAKPAIFVGKTDLLQLAALIKSCKVYITPDSAPMHVAAAVKTPFIAFFGPTGSVRHLPPAEKYIVLRKDLSCSPCYSSRCRILTHACMREISPEEVAEKVGELMGNKL